MKEQRACHLGVAEHGANVWTYPGAPQITSAYGNTRASLHDQGPGPSTARRRLVILTIREWCRVDPPRASRERSLTPSAWLSVAGFAKGRGGDNSGETARDTAGCHRRSCFPRVQRRAIRQRRLDLGGWPGAGVTGQSIQAAQAHSRLCTRSAPRFRSSVR